MQFASHDLPDHQGRQGLYMHTFTGLRYFPCDPRVEDVRIEDIAHHLSQQCRFAGATTEFLSVAEHLVFCSLIDGGDVTPQDQLEALMHDAPEAYIQDFIRPIKYLPEFLPIYKELEAKNEAVIAEKFNLRLPWSAHVKRCDELAVNVEMRELIVNEEKGYLHERIDTDGYQLLRLTPRHAEYMFLQRFYELDRARQRSLHAA